MKIYKTLLTAATVFTCLCLNAQDKIVELKFHENKRTFTQSPFNEVTVLDSRVDTTKIGLAQVGLMNTLVVARFKESTAITFEKYIRTSIQGLPQQGKLLLINLRGLNSSEKTSGMSEKGFLRFGADAYFKESDSSFRKIASFDSLYVVKAMDVTAKVFHLIPEALNTLLEKICRVDSLRADSATVSLQEIKTGLYKRWSALPVIAATVYPDGVYRSFRNFQNNISEPLTLVLKEKENGGFKVPAGKNGALKEKGITLQQVYAAAVNGQLYINIYGELFAMEKQNSSFYFAAAVPDEQNQTMGYMIFGVLGAALADKRVSHFYLDMDTGKAIEYALIHH